MATGGTIQYGIKFNVDSTSLNQLKQELKSIQDISLTQYQQMNPNASKNTQKALEDLKEVKKLAAEVENVLNKAFNSKLNITNINQVRKEIANLGINELYNGFSKLGPIGTATFRQIALSASLMQSPIKETNKLLDKMAESFGNTVRWGITSSIWNNITGSIQKAWNYTKNLDASLNDIRVVTGQSADQMDKLAKNANKVAQALGNTTLDYTKAALIYYQQGLSDSEVQARTDVTLKLSNVLNTSAQEVSDYMTAIWNNFDNGSQSLEHYADVITALGAATAASSEEIATGLQKFSAVANTVGLSYEYATAALATVVAKTRQSADTVGTAFKTLFARIQDLELGKTLDDGTTLGQYAQALQKVGISIKDSNGQLKNMDSILAEMGAKWNTLNKAQQVALAQNVAGTRQYTQLVALMDGWDEFGINLQVAMDSTGTLQKQQEIYMESTEAHLNKLTASLEKLMDALIDNKVINGLIDGITSVISLFNNFIDSIGGGGNALILFGAALTRIFNTQISRGIVSFTDKVRGLKNDLFSKDLTKSFLEEFESQIKNADKTTKNYIKTLKEVIPLANKFLSEEDKEKLKEKLDENNQLVTKRDTLIGEVEKNQGVINNFTQPGEEDFTYRDMREKLGKTEIKSIGFQNEVEAYYREVNKTVKENNEKTRDNLTSTFNQLRGNIGDAWGNVFSDLGKNIKQEDVDTIQNALNIFDKAAKNGTFLAQDKNGNIGFSQEIKDAMISLNQLKDVGIDTVQEIGNAIDSFDPEKGDPIDKQLERITKEVKKSKKDLKEFSQNAKEIDTTMQFVKATAGLSQVIGGIISLVNLTKIWENETLTTGEKITQTFNNLLLIIPTIVSGVYAIVTAINAGLLPAMGRAIAAAWAFLLAHPATLAITAIVALTAAVVGAIAVYDKWFSEEAKINQELERTQKALENATQAALDLEEAINGYKSAQDNIKKLTEGTLEFYNAIVKANEESQKLIDTLNLKAGQDYALDENGLIKINENVLEAKQQEAIRETYRAQAANVGAQLHENEYKQRQLIKKFTGKVNSYAGQETNARITEEQGAQMLSGQGSIYNGAAKWGSNLGELTNISLVRRATQGNLNENEKIINQKIDQIIPEVQDMSKNQEKTIDITQQVSSILPEMKALQAEQVRLTNQRNLALVRGYANSSQQSWLNSQFLKTQENVSTLALERHQEKYNLRNTIKPEDVFYGDIGTNIIGKAWTGLTVSDDKLNNKIKVASNYLDKTGKASLEDLDRWREENWKKYAEMINSVDMGVALDMYNNSLDTFSELGLQDVINKYKKIESNINDQQNINGDQKFNTTSSQYILQAISSFERGTITAKDVSKLTNEEKEFINQYITKKNASSATDSTKELLEVNGTTVAIDKDVIKEFYTVTDEAGKSVERLREEHNLYNQVLASSAEQLGTTTEALDFYAYSIANANGEMQEFSAEAAEDAVALYKFNKTYNDTRDIFDKNSEGFEQAIKDLKNHKISSRAAADAVGEVLKGLKSIGIYIKNSDLNDDNIVSKINKLLTGTEKEAKKAYMELYDLSRLNVLADAFNINLDDKQFESYKEKFKNIIKSIDDIKPGNNLSKEFAGELGQMIKDAELTTDQINALAQGLGVEIPVDLKYDKEGFNIKNESFTTAAQSVMHSYDGEMPVLDESGNYINKPVHYKWVETIEPKTDNYIVPDDMNIKVKTNKHNVGNKINTAISPSGKNPKGKSNSLTKGEADRYHQVNTQIAKIDKSLQRLENTQKKVLGSDLLKNLNNQWKNLNTQVKNYNDKLKIAYNEQKEVQQKLKDLGLGVKFNKDGTIANYVEMYNKALKQLNAAEKKYASDSKQVKKAKEKFEDLQKLMDRNDELISSFIPEILQQIRDAWDKQVENSIEQFHIGINLAVDIKDIKLNWADFRSKVVNQLQDSDILGNVNLSKERTAANMENAEARRKQLNTAVNELQRNIAGNANLTGDDRQKAIQEVKDNYEAAMQLYTELAEERNNAEKLYQQALEQEKQALQDQLDLYNQINTQLEHDKKLVELVYGTKAYDKLVKYDKQQDANNKEQLKVYKAQEDVMKRRFEEAKAERDRAKAAMEGLTQGTDAWQRANSEFIKASENLSNAQTNYEDAMTQANQALEQSIESLHKTLEDQAEELAQSYGQQVTGMAGELEYAQDEWDLINKHADQYLDTINRLSGENQLESRYLESIEKATSPSIQKKLKDAMDSEMKYLREKDKLSQYDLDRANKKLQVTLAQIALEEAQDNKSTMRLRRDSQGNYRYQYVADEDNVKKAEEDLQKARVDLYNFDKERMKSTHNDILALEKDFRDKLKEIETNSSYSEEERAERLKLIYEEYYGEDGYLPQAYELANTARENVTESAFESLAELQGQTLEEFTNLTKTEQDAIMTGLIPAWDSVASHMAEAGAQAELMLEYMNALKEIQREYQNNVAGDLSVAGQSTEDLANGLDEKTEGIQGLITPISQVVDEQNKIVEAAKAWTDEINTQIGKLDELLEAIENAKSALLEFEEDELEKVGIAMGFNRNDSHYKFTDTVKSSDDFSQNTDFQQFLSLKNYHLENGITDAIKEFQRDLGFTGSAVNGIANKTLWTAAKMAGFSSGGYTGDWGSTDGRVGILHEKELVLNAKDTENILEATYAMRQAMLSARANSISSSEIAPLGGDVLEQNVHIEATFPNATSANEIEEALRNLVNAAAQRRRKLNKN